MKLPSQPPITFNATPESILEAAKRQIATTNAVWDQVVASVSPDTANWDNTMSPIIQDENKKHAASRYLGFYKSTSPDADLRNASSTATGLFDNADVELYARPDMFALIDAIRRQPITARDPSAQDMESQYYLDKVHRRFIQNGCALQDADVKSKFMQCQRRIKEIERQCNRNHHDESTRVWFSRDEVSGVPAAALERLAADEHGVSVSTKVNQSDLVLRHANNGETRKKMFYAIQNKMPANVPLFRELIWLRDEAARLLGYPHHAALRISDKMMRDHEAVLKILQDLEVRLVPEGAKDAAELLSIKLAETDRAGKLNVTDHENRLFFWDVPYLTHIQEKEQKSVSVEVSDYYELHNTLESLLEIFKQVFGVYFQKLPSDDLHPSSGTPLVWHKDVLMYAVWDKTEEIVDDGFMGYAYLDLYPRQGKYTHSGHYQLDPNFANSDGSHHKASSVLVMNYMHTVDAPTLLALDDVRKLFHEIGHLVHALCTVTKYAVSQAVDRDFVEAPALMFEHFFRQTQLIQDVSNHYAWLSPVYEKAWRNTLPADRRSSSPLPPRKLPAHVASSIANSDVTRRALRTGLKTLFFAKYDFMIHSPESHGALEKINLTELYNKMKSEICSCDGGEALGEGLQWGHGETVFRAVINKYDAGYYSYLLGDIIASDIFNCGFKSDPLSQSAGRRYRDTVLKLGGSSPEMETITKYLGRRPNTEAFLEHLGL